MISRKNFKISAKIACPIDFTKFCYEIVPWELILAKSTLCRENVFLMEKDTCLAQNYQLLDLQLFHQKICENLSRILFGINSCYKRSHSLTRKWNDFTKKYQSKNGMERLNFPKTISCKSLWISKYIDLMYCNFTKNFCMTYFNFSRKWYFSIFFSPCMNNGR